MRANPPIQYAFAERLAHLSTAAWDHVTRDQSFFLQREYLELLERCGPSEIEPRYALVFRDDRPVAAIAAQSPETEKEN